MADPKQIAGDLRGSFRGRLQFDGLTRGLYSTDASPFQVVPLGVALPEDADDLAVLVRYCSEHAVPVIARGAGTGIAGESLGPGLVIDLSRHFRRVVEIGPDWVTVEPGVVHAELNAELARHGRRFAPDPSSGASCTLGGMVATNASGGNAFRHGYTRDHVLGLVVVWDNGTADDVGSNLTPQPPSLGGKGEPGSPPSLPGKGGWGVRFRLRPNGRNPGRDCRVAAGQPRVNPPHPAADRVQPLRLPPPRRAH